MAAVE